MLFVYASDLPEIHSLETYRPTVVTEIYADDGQMVGSFALQRRILMTYEQCPKILYNAVTAIEDQHFQDHWGIDFPRIAGAAVRNVLKHHITAGASTITMQLAGNLFLDRSDKSFHRKIQEMLLALQIERRYTKPQIFTMYSNQVYLAHGNYGFAAASQFYFGKPVTDLKLEEAALLAGMVNGPKFSPLNNPTLALARRNLVLHRMGEEGKISAAEEANARKLPLGLHVQYPRNDLAPYFFEDIRKYLEATYGTEAVHERGLRVYTTLNIAMQRAANQSVRDGLHSYDRRHGWRGKLPNILRDNLGTWKITKTTTGAAPSRRALTSPGWFSRKRKAPPSRSATIARSSRPPTSPGPDERSFRLAAARRPRAIFDSGAARKHRARATRATTRPAGRHGGHRQSHRRNQSHGGRLQFRRL